MKLKNLNDLKINNLKRNSLKILNNNLENEFMINKNDKKIMIIIMILIMNLQ